MAPEHPFWIRTLTRAASRRATDAEIGDVLEEYQTEGRGVLWLLRQLLSIVRRQRASLTMAERGAQMLSNVRNDIRYALRTLVRNPGFAAAAIVPIALGIGMNTAVFSILNSVAWRPLPVPGADALVSVHQEFRGGPRRSMYGARALFSIPEYRAYRDEAHTLSGLMAYSREWTVTLGREHPREIDGILVTCNYFDVLEVAPSIGAGFTPQNCGSPDAPPVVVLSHALWTTAFGGDRRVLQQTIVLNGRDVTVVGVAAEDFDGIDMAKSMFFAPTSAAGALRPETDLQENPHVSWLTLVGRQRHDAALAEVRADLSLVASRIDQQQPGRTTRLIVEPAAALSLPVQRQGLLRAGAVVMAAFGLVLLIAAANVANMLLARATARTREIAIRLSVGATRGRVIQQLLTESAVIALAGAACGALLFSWSFQALLPWLLSSVPDAERLRIDAMVDGTVLSFGFALTAVTAIVFGLVPALQASRCDVIAMTKADASGARSGRGWMRGALIGTQVALCTMLLIPAGLLARALHAAHTFDVGFDYHNVAAVSIELRGPRYEGGQAAAFQAEWFDRVRALPGVESLAQIGRVPLSPGRSVATIRVGDDSEGRVVDVNSVSPEFFSLLGMPIVRGRAFTDGEADAVVVTESTARRLWPGEDAVGRTIATGDRRRQVVGIVRDAQVSQSPEAVANYVYLPATRPTEGRISILARTKLDVAALAAAVRAETARMDASLVAKVQPLSDNLGLLQTLSAISASVAGVVSTLGLGLAALGVYGVVSYVVSRRRREVGVRMALGAGGRDVQQLILRQTLRPVVIGILVGVAVAAAIVRLLQSVLFGISPFDPIAFVGAPLMVLAIAGAAAFVPTRRAMRVDPVSVLRAE